MTGAASAAGDWRRSCSRLRCMHITIHYHLHCVCAENERKKEQAKVDKMKAENADPHDLKQAVSRDPVAAQHAFAPRYAS